VKKPEALRLLLYLTAFEQQLEEARKGCVPVRHSVMTQMQIEADETNRARLAMLAKVIAEHILIPPKFTRYPEVEEVLWRTVQKAFLGEIEIDDALERMTKKITEIVHCRVVASVEA
jgi:ABC-type glycerol-3-phosphate transport system substrate-binding protein